jgi:hypothetical protein
MARRARAEDALELAGHLLDAEAREFDAPYRAHPLPPRQQRA